MAFIQFTRIHKSSQHSSLNDMQNLSKNGPQSRTRTYITLLSWILLLLIPLTPLSLEPNNKQRHTTSTANPAQNYANRTSLLAHTPQTTTASITGTVTDEQDAVIPGVTITMFNSSTGLKRQVTTNDSGYFIIPLLPPNTYTLTTQSDNFAPFDIPALVLNVGDQRTLVIKLKIKDLQSSVTVRNADSSINTSPTLGTVIDRQVLDNLPLNGRSFQSIISLTPGVTIAIPNTTNAGQFSANGQRTNANYFMVDGVSANIGVSTIDLIGEEAAGSLPSLTSFGGTNNLISVDALQEFRIDTSTFAPEFGRSPGAQVSLVSRSGTRDLHGTLYEYFRNNKLDANDYFANRAGLPRAQLRQNQFGFVAGGPIILPRFGEGPKAYYNGRDHSFFFVSYEGLRLRQPQTAVTTVPALRVRTLAAPTVKFLFDAFPLPTGPEVGTTGKAPFTGTYSDQSNLNATSFRIDHNFSTRFSLFGRFNTAPSNSITRAKGIVPPNNLVAFNLKTVTLTIGSTQVLNSHTFNDLRINYSRSNGKRHNVLDNYGGAVPVTISQIAPDFARDLNATVTIQTISNALLIGNYNDNLQRQFNLVDNFSHVRGSHNFKFGLDYRRLTPISRPRDYEAIQFFANEAAIATGRLSIALISAFKGNKPIYNNYSTYFQDTWKTSSRLTLTYGTRWEVNPPPSEANGHAPFALSSSDPLTTTLAPLGTPLWKTTFNNFAPRFGLSYQLLQIPGRELLIRGGIGLYYDLGTSTAGEAFTRGPFRTSPILLFNEPYPLSGNKAAPPPFPLDGRNASTYAPDPRLKLPYTWQWNITLQQSLGSNQTLSASYVGALGRRILRPRLFTLQNPNFTALQYADNAATSDYHSLQMQLNRRLSNNFQALASYTWSHAIDDISDETANLTPVRGNTDFDVRHNFSTALQYQSPWKNKRRLGWFINDWQSDLITHVQSAYPFTPYIQQFVRITGLTVSQWPSLIQGAPVYLSDPTVAGGRRINPAALLIPPTGTQGNIGRNSLRGFPTYQFDFALHRIFNLSEQAKLELRGEVFNIFNHANFGLPVADMNSPFFGQSTQMLGRNLGGLSPIFQLGGPRSIQLGIRLSF